MDKNKPKPIGEILNNVLKKVGAYENFKIQSNWEQIVGKEIASVTDPLLIESGTIEIRVKNTIWKRELDSMSDAIIREINVFLGKKIVNKIVFKIGLRRRRT
ncbi:DUF721 domain-containing protein [candidate division WOR-3 bacterium]|nr:DUF721 domain-containing protein [candidate division WOR-3 bacterium]